MVEQAIANIFTMYKHEQARLGSQLTALRAQQEKAWQRFAGLGWPSRRDEDWKYTNLSSLSQRPYALASAGTQASLKAAELEAYLLADAFNLVFVDGSWSPELSDGKALPAGLRLLPLQEAWQQQPQRMQELLQAQAPQGEQALLALNEALMQQGFYLHVAANVQAPLLHFLYLSSQPLGTEQTRLLTVRNLLDIEGQATLVESFVSLASDEGAELLKQSSAAGFAEFSNAVTDVRLGKNAQFSHYSVQAQSRRCAHFSQLRVLQAEASSLSSFALGLGGRLARHSVEVWQEGSEAMTQLNGLYLGKGQQQTEQRTAVQHAVAAGKSEQYYKGILDDEARGVFLGKVKVAEAAQKIRASQLNKNLLLSGEAEVDTKPELEIEADDVKCSHGATVSQLRPEELFYLQCRGVEPEQAKLLLAEAFAAELLYRLTDERLQGYLRRFLKPYFTSAGEQQAAREGSRDD